MKVKMLEHVQGAGIAGRPLDGENTVNVLVPDVSYEVDDTLGAWLLEHRKAVELESEPYYGSRPEPELRHDDEIYQKLTAEQDETENTDETGIEKPRRRRSKKP